jgi:hypothetical protein
MSESYSLPPPPLMITRQIATGLLGSPITLSRETSTTSSHNDTRNPNQIMREHLCVYRTYLEHEITFVDNEIQALIVRTPYQDPVQEGHFLDLRDKLKLRYNDLSAKRVRVISLLEVM